jgi:hypothetical protein
MVEETGVDEPYNITVEMGELLVDITGADSEWVSEEFNRVWAERLVEADKMSDEERKQLGLYQ